MSHQHDEQYQSAAELRLALVINEINIYIYIFNYRLFRLGIMLNMPVERYLQIKWY
jgi:hypothetical protein